MGCCCNNNKKKSRRLLFVTAAVVIGVVFFAWLNSANGQTATNNGSGTVTNQTCPVLTDEAIDPDIWVEYQGERVYFCCNKCKRKFEQQPQAYLANLPQFADPVEAAPRSAGQVNEHAGHSHAEQTVGQDGADDKDAESGSHDHADHGHADATSGLKRLTAWLGNFHPPSTDFPVALLISAAIAELLLVVTGRQMFDSAARFCVWLGSVSAMGAVALGWFFAGFRLTDPDWIMTLHRWLGTGAGALALVLLLLNVAAHRRDDRGRNWLPWYRVTLFTAASAVATNGFFGGAMVYGLDHYAW
jgi:uncharacterized membrane protein